MEPRVRNCDVRFKYRCPESWSGLERTDDECVRFCSVCAKSVYHCVDVSELVARAEAGDCVAIDVDDERDGTLGFLAPDAEFSMD